MAPHSQYPGYNTLSAHEYATAASMGQLTQLSAQMSLNQLGPVGRSPQKPSRAVYLGNVPDHVTEAQVANIAAHYGDIESVWRVAEKHCAFINFVYSETAALFLSDAQMRGCVLGGANIHVGCAKERSNASKGGRDVHQPSRSVYLGNVPDHITDAQIKALASKFGGIESVMLMAEKHCAFVNFLDLNASTSFLQHSHINGLTLDGVVLRVGYAKARALSNAQRGPGGASPAMQPSRAVYLGNMPATSTDEQLRNLCTPFGEIESTAMNTSKHYAFVNFVDESAAAAFVNHSTGTELMLDGHRIQVGYAKAKPLGDKKDGEVAAAAGGVENGSESAHPQTEEEGSLETSRAVYLGNVPVQASEVHIQQLAMLYGEVESVRIMGDKHCAFVNYVEESSAEEFMKQAQSCGVIVCGAPVRVGWAKASAGQLTGTASEQLQPSRSVYLGNVPVTATQEEITSIAEPFGEVESVRVMVKKRCAFINFSAEESASKFVEAARNTGINMHGSVLQVGWAKAKLATAGGKEGEGEDGEEEEDANAEDAEGGKGETEKSEKDESGEAEQGEADDSEKAKEDTSTKGISKTEEADSASAAEEGASDEATAPAEKVANAE